MVAGLHLVVLRRWVSGFLALITRRRVDFHRVQLFPLTVMGRLGNFAFGFGPAKFDAIRLGGFGLRFLGLNFADPAQVDNLSHGFLSFLGPITHRKCSVRGLIAAL